MKGIALESCEVGTVSSCKDGSVKLTVYTAELRPSEKGLVMDFHGKACAVTIMPSEGEFETVKVDTERDTKTPSQRLRSVLFLCWKNHGSEGTFDDYYNKRMEKILDWLKTELPK